MDKVIRKTYQATETKAVDDSRSLLVKISTSSPDRSRDIVIPSGAVFDNYLRNPVVALAHKYDGLSIAKTEELQITNEGIVAKVTFPEKGVYPVADTVYELYKGGFMNAWSIGFIPLEIEDIEGGGHEFKKWELLEYSAVLVPDNPEALTLLRSKGIDTKEVEDLLSEKGVIPFKDTPTASPDTAWDGSAEVKDATVEDLKVMCAWYDNANPDIKTSYKLPHHKAGGDHPVVLRGVYAAMGALLGARGGVNIPDSDRKGVYNHLAKHYQQYNQEPPAFKEYTEEELKGLFGEKASEDHKIVSNIEVDAKENKVKIIFTNGDTSVYDGDKNFIEHTDELLKAYRETKEGRVLSEKNRKLIAATMGQLKSVLVALDQLLKATEPSQDEAGKTVHRHVAALRQADKIIGIVLRDIRADGELGIVPDDSRMPVAVGAKGVEK